MSLRIVRKMRFCPKNESFLPSWTKNGISECFVDTIGASIPNVIILIFGTIQLFIYWKYATSISNERLRYRKLFILQIVLLFLYPLIEVTKFLLQAFYFEDRGIYGFMILNVVTAVIAYPYSFFLVYIERNYQLPSVPSKGHGFILLLFWSFCFMKENLLFITVKSSNWWNYLDKASSNIHLAIFLSQYLSCMIIFILGMKAPGIMSTRDYLDLNNLMSNSSRVDRDSASQGSTWRNFWRKCKILAPFLWPRNDAVLQGSVLVCFLLLAAGRIINLYVPIYSKMIVDSLSIVPLEFRWDYVLIFVVFKFLQGGGTGGMGLLNNLRSFLWIRIQQYTTREIEVDLFRHIHTLSLSWHLRRKTGEVTRVVDRGTDSMNNLLNYILFSIVPCIVDIIVAVLYFITYFNAYFGLIVFITMAVYLGATITMTEWRTKFQRSMNLADNATKAQCTDSLLNYETVKYYGNEMYEVNNYKKTVLHYQKEEWKSVVSLNALNLIQNVIICGGLLAGSLLCVHMVVTGQGLTVGDYVLFSSYIIQLYVPLNWFGTYYRMIQKNFIDMENMFDLLKEPLEVEDIPSAPDIIVKAGHIKFQNVTFSYLRERVILKNICFEVPAGKTVALVGPSGSGKSTIIRLLFRFYDVDQGSIFIDNQNIACVTQKSLRNNIGVVPQDTVLFNNTINYNIRYGRVSADDMEVMDAAKHAEIHEKILTFPQGYDTEVGERGLKLSGGEKQRIAIARTILKSPPIILLDEATSSLDTQTERNIQAAVNKIWQNRTIVIVAHRLSTVVNADEILVLKDGEIIERGNHNDLLSNNGMYSQMWQDQLKEEKQETE